MYQLLYRKQGCYGFEILVLGFPKELWACVSLMEGLPCQWLKTNGCGFEGLN